jgi:hypothetical protein
MTASELSRLVALDISKTPEAFLDLPLPEESSLIGATPKALRRAADSFHRSWNYLVSARDLYLEGEATVPSTGETLNGKDLWWRLFLVVAPYYDFSIRLLLRVAKRNQSLYPLPGLGLTKAEEWMSKISREDLKAISFEVGGPEEEEEDDDAKLWELDRSFAALLASTYITALSAAVIGELLRRTNTSLELIEEIDGISHRSTVDLFTGPPPSGRLSSLTPELSKRLVASVFEQWMRIYDRPGWNKSHKIGPFSSIRLAELAPLANRDARMGEKYGNKRIEKVFEQQLALIVQSFGLYVVSTRTGQRTVDLICISADPTARFTFLLEAKTSARPYALPRDDARALLEYIREVRGGLTTLPPLHFVLMVGPSPSATLEKKLQGLEAEASLPIRYCSADELAQLREVVAGPLPLNDFADHLLLASRVVPAGFAQTMRSRVDELRSSHEALVRTMLAPVR